MLKGWFHGSPVKNIKAFIITPESRYDSMEGRGIYLTKDYKIARGYAGSEGSVYEVEVKGSLLDMTTDDDLNRMIKMASEISGVDLTKLEGAENTFQGIRSGWFQIGDHAGLGVGWQLKNLLLNDEEFLQDRDGDAKALEVESKINEYLNEHDLWLYEDSKLGQVLLVKNPDKVKPAREIEVGSDDDVEML